MVVAYFGDSMARTEYSQRIVEKLRSIPKGMVATYGGIAASAGNPRGARTVVWLLNSTSRAEDLPWHRVISSKGTISLKPGDGYELQRALLESEGVEFDDRGGIDLARFEWSYVG